MKVTIKDLAKQFNITSFELLNIIKDVSLKYKNAEEEINKEDKILLENVLIRNSNSKKFVSVKKVTTVKAEGSGKIINVVVKGKKVLKRKVKEAPVITVQKEDIQKEQFIPNTNEVKKEETELEKAIINKDSLIQDELFNKYPAKNQVSVKTQDNPLENFSVKKSEINKTKEEISSEKASSIKIQDNKLNSHTNQNKIDSKNSIKDSNENVSIKKTNNALSNIKESKSSDINITEKTIISEKPKDKKIIPKNDLKTNNKAKDHSRKGNIKTNTSFSNKNNIFKSNTIDSALEKYDGVVRGGGKNKNKKENKHSFKAPTNPIIREVSLGETIAVADLADQMSVKSAEVIKFMFKMGTPVTINKSLDQDTAQIIIEEFGHKVKIINDNEIEDQLLESLKHDGVLIERAPVVTVIGHVDHGKTSLLDYIRSTKVAKGEAGGITQHIGAYRVKTDKGMITFLDTPGHAAFTQMRARGVKATDVVILVVAADDGVMPQTQEAIEHSKSAGVPIVVAMTKVDKPQANIDAVKQALSGYGVIPEEWGGDCQFVGVSSKTGEGIDNLLDAILLQSEVLELKANPKAPGKGVVIESRLDRGKGSVATILVQNGTLKQGDIALVGTCYGRVRALNDENGKSIKEAGPSFPVELLGLNGTPNAGDELTIVSDERKAREVAIFRQEKEKALRDARGNNSLSMMFAAHNAKEKKNLNIILKADVQGSLEAIKSSLLQLATEEVQVVIVSSGVGGISESDVNLAISSNAIMFGFNVRADATGRKLIEQENVELRYYNIIYDMIEDVKKAMSGLLGNELREEIIGIAEVRDVFRSPKFGLIAGCMVIEGSVLRSKPIRVLRKDVVIYEGELESLRRFKDDANEVRAGMECGIGVKNYNDVKVGDLIEVYNRTEIARTL